MVLCADSLVGIKEAIEAAYPLTEYQRCIVHVVRNTLKYVSYKDRKAFAADLRTIYHASDEQIGHKRMLAMTEKWESKYPNSMQRWADLGCHQPDVQVSTQVRKATNAIENLNSGYRRLNRQRSVFPSSTILLKVLYMATFELSKRWTGTLRNWGPAYGELAIMYPDRLS